MRATAARTQRESTHTHQPQHAALSAATADAVFNVIVVVAVVAGIIIIITIFMSVAERLHGQRRRGRRRQHSASHCRVDDKYAAAAPAPAAQAATAWAAPVGVGRARARLARGMGGDVRWCVAWCARGLMRCAGLMAAVVCLACVVIETVACGQRAGAQQWAALRRERQGGKRRSGCRCAVDGPAKPPSQILSFGALAILSTCRGGSAQRALTRHSRRPDAAEAEIWRAVVTRPPLFGR